MDEYEPTSADQLEFVRTHVQEHAGTKPMSNQFPTSVRGRRQYQQAMDEYDVVRAEKEAEGLQLFTDEVAAFEKRRSSYHLTRVGYCGPMAGNPAFAGSFLLKHCANLRGAACLFDDRQYEWKTTLVRQSDGSYHLRVKPEPGLGLTITGITTSPAPCVEFREPMMEGPPKPGSKTPRKHKIINFTSKDLNQHRSMDQYDIIVQLNHYDVRADAFLNGHKPEWKKDCLARCKLLFTGHKMLSVIITRMNVFPPFGRHTSTWLGYCESLRSAAELRFLIGELLIMEMNALHWYRRHSTFVESYMEDVARRLQAVQGLCNPRESRFLGGLGLERAGGAVSGSGASSAGVTKASPAAGAADGNDSDGSSVDYPEIEVDPTIQIGEDGLPRPCVPKDTPLQALKQELNRLRRGMLTMSGTSLVPELFMIGKEVSDDAFKMDEDGVEIVNEQEAKANAAMQAEEEVDLMDLDSSTSEDEDEDEDEEDDQNTNEQQDDDEDEDIDRYEIPRQNKNKTQKPRARTKHRGASRHTAPMASASRPILSSGTSRANDEVNVDADAGRSDSSRSIEVPNRPHQRKSVESVAKTAQSGPSSASLVEQRSKSIDLSSLLLNGLDDDEYIDQEKEDAGDGSGTSGKGVTQVSRLGQEAASGVKASRQGLSGAPTGTLPAKTTSSLSPSNKSSSKVKRIAKRPSSAGRLDSYVTSNLAKIQSDASQPESAQLAEASPLRNKNAGPSPTKTKTKVKRKPSPSRLDSLVGGSGGIGSDGLSSPGLGIASASAEQAAAIIASSGRDQTNLLPTSGTSGKSRSKQQVAAFSSPMPSNVSPDGKLKRKRSRKETQAHPEQFIGSRASAVAAASPRQLVSETAAGNRSVAFGSADVAAVSPSLPHPNDSTSNTIRRVPGSGASTMSTFMPSSVVLPTSDTLASETANSYSFAGVKRPRPNDTDSTSASAASHGYEADAQQVRIKVNGQFSMASYEPAAKRMPVREDGQPGAAAAAGTLSPSNSTQMDAGLQYDFEEADDTETQRKYAEALSLAAKISMEADALGSGS